MSKNGERNGRNKVLLIRREGRLLHPKQFIISCVQMVTSEGGRPPPARDNVPPANRGFAREWAKNSRGPLQQVPPCAIHTWVAALPWDADQDAHCAEQMPTFLADC